MGEKVASPAGAKRVIGFLHAEAEPEASYIRIATEGGGALDISALHHLPANGRLTDAADVVIGDVLDTPRGMEAVVRVENIVAKGLYHPFVEGGVYFVDGILSSDFFGLTPPRVWPLVRGYVWARFKLGIPVIPIGHGLFPKHDWLAELFLRAGGPVGVQKYALFGVIVASSILTELVNAAVEYDGLAVALGAVGVAALGAKVAKRRHA